MKRARSLGDIVTNGLCTGCGLCESLVGRETLKMELNAEGFLRPKRLGGVFIHASQAIAQAR